MMTPRKTLHKETFYQRGDSLYNIPSSWVVQYWVEGEPFCEAAYFETEIKKGHIVV